MKEYYKAPIKRACAKNFTLVNNKFKYDRKDIVVENEVVFYYNYFNVLVRQDTKFPIILEEEVDDTIINNFSFSDHIPSKIEIVYVDPTELKKIDYNIEEQKVKRRRKLFSRKK